MLLVTVLWAVTPAIACMLPMRSMTPAEHECCKKMVQHCGSSAMPASHSCCQRHDRDGAVNPVPTYSPTRPFDVAMVPQSAILFVASQPILPVAAGSEAPPPEASPGDNSILRI